MKRISFEGMIKYQNIIRIIIKDVQMQFKTVRDREGSIEVDNAYMDAH